MNWIDLVLILILIVSIASSVQRGFILSALDLVCWIGSIALGILLYRPITGLLERHVVSPGLFTAPLVFIVILFIFRILLDTAAQRLLQSIPPKTHFSTLNRIFGILPGMVNGFLWIMVLSTLLFLMPINNGMAENARESKFSEWVVQKTEWLEERFSPVFVNLFNKIIPKEDAAIGESESISLPFKVDDPVRRPDLEAKMLSMVNAEREKQGLKPLKADPTIAVVALKHSADMFARGYFSHNTPEGKTAFDRMRADNVRFLLAGENLAFAQTLPIAHQGLMDSPGHRANILQPAFGRLGIGILDGGIYGLMITQNFRN